MNNDFNYVSYKIHSNKLHNKEIKVILIADLHGYFNNKRKAKKLAEAIKERKPHHIIIAGDTMQGDKWETKKKLAPLVEFIRDLSNIAPVFISQGNHDLAGAVNDNRKVRDNSFKKLEKINLGKVFVLINDVVEYDGFKILGYTPETKDIIHKLDIQEHGIAHDIFINEYQENGVKLNKKDSFITEFVGHNPFLIARSENGIGLGDLKYIDTFYAGHIHNGYHRSSTITKNPDKYLYSGYIEQPYSLDKNKRIVKRSIRPYIYSRTILCRGTVYIDDDANRRILLLQNGNYYINNSKEVNKDNWIRISINNANEYINRNNLHALVITGGINKFFKLSLPGDKPEITEIIYMGKKY